LFRMVSTSSDNAQATFDSLIPTPVSLADAVYSSALESTYPAWDGRWRATECLRCHRAMLYRAYNRPAEHKFGSPFVMELGLLLEDEIVARLAVQGIRVEHRGRVFTSTRIPIICHPDGFYSGELVIQNGILSVRQGKLRLLEIKTMAHEYFLECKTFGLAKTRLDLVGQAQLYLAESKEELGVSEGTWLVMDRDMRNRDGLFTEDFSYNSAIVGKLDEKIIIAKDAVDRGLEPEALSCSHEFLDRLLCPWGHLCGPIPPEIYDATLNTAAIRFLECKSIQDDCDDVVEVCRAMISQVMEDKGVTSLHVTPQGIQAGYGLTATMREEKRTVTNWDVAKATLSREQLDQIFEPQLNQVLRIERDKKR